MELRFIYPRWGSLHVKWPKFLEKIKQNGYQGVEAHLPLVGKERKETIRELRNFGLEFIGQHFETKEVNFERHKESLKRHLYNLLDAEPMLINSHTGMDFFSFSNNVELIELAEKIEDETGIPIVHETHRSRFCFAAHICSQYLKELPFLRLTADFAHWTCVAESLLENQQEAIQMAINRTVHVHARVGSAQNPQVIDPRDKTYERELEQFKNWWRSMIKAALQRKESFLTMMPEHGPYPYNQYHPFTKKPLADQWEANQFIKKELSKDWKDMDR